MRLALVPLLVALIALPPFPTAATPPATGDAATDPPTRTIRSLQILAPIYRGDPASDEHLDDDAVAGIQSAIEFGRLFYFRNTRAQLHLDITYLVIDAPMPDTAGPSYQHLEKDLRERGIADRQYDGIYVAGREARGNWGGFHIFDGTGGAFGGVSRGKGDAPALPGVAPGSGDRILHQVPFHGDDTWYYAAWNFVHEFQHALDLVIAKNSGRPDLLHAHPYADRNEPYFSYGHPNPHGGAQHWSWVAYTLRSFDNWLDVTGVTDSTITFTDADGDGLPDDDPRLPIDEKRLGSDPRQADTDCDGLDDLDEFAADIYRGSDPTRHDTDGDGLPDGQDPHPTVALAPSIPLASPAPVIDGQPDDAYAPLFTRVYHTNLPAFENARVDAAWTDQGLYLFIHTSKKANLYLQIDGSPDNGFWEGGDTYGVHINEQGELRGEWGDKDNSGGGGKAAWSERGLEAFIPATMGQGLSGEVNYGGKRRPEDDAAGLTLTPGNKISLNLELSTEQGKALFTPNWSMFDTTLAD